MVLSFVLDGACNAATGVHCARWKHAMLPQGYIVLDGSMQCCHRVQRKVGKRIKGNTDKYLLVGPHLYFATSSVMSTVQKY